VKKGGTVEQELKPIPSLCLVSPGIWRWSRLFYFEIEEGDYDAGSCLEGKKPQNKRA
jgi:hypothetical protein